MINFYLEANMAKLQENQKKHLNESSFFHVIISLIYPLSC